MAWNPDATRKAQASLSAILAETLSVGGSVERISTKIARQQMLHTVVLAFGKPGGK